MSDINKLLGKLLDSGVASGFAGGLAGGMAGNMLSGKKGKKLRKKALKYGGIAAIGTLAYGAYQRYNSSKGAAQQSTGTIAPPRAVESAAFIPPPTEPARQERLGLTLIRAMIGAARCDGILDAQESQAIFQRIETLGLPAEDRDLLIREMGKPVDMDAIVNSATTPEIAAEIYVASLLAIDVDTDAERSYLGMLAARMNLPQDLVEELHQQVERETEPASP